MDTIPPLRKVVSTEFCDEVVRVERLECGHTKSTMMATERPAYRRRCVKCQHGEPVPHA